MHACEGGMQWDKATSITGDVLNMAGSSLNSIFNVWSKLEQILAPSVPSSGPSVVPELKELVHEAVYEVYSPSPPDEPGLEIVFFHGLQLENARNAYFTTWMTADNSHLWLKTWLVAKFPRARILTIAYDSAAMKTHERGRLDMYCTGENLVQLLTGDSVKIGRTRCPIVLVGHCLGGLVLKELCLSGQWLLARNPKLQDIRNFMSSLKGMFFYGTPHCGALLGEKLDRECFNGPLLEEMDILKNSVSRSNQAFSQFKIQYGWMTSGVGELDATFVKCLGQKVHMVPEASTRPYMDSYHSGSGDHYSICRPENDKSASFQFFCSFLINVCREVTTAHGKSQRHEINESHQMDFRTAHRSLGQTLYPLPFGPDRNFVPLIGSISEVRKALEDPDAPQVVTLHGGPGMGKSSLAKYLALDYQNAIKQLSAPASTTVCFPDGVFYLLCGRGAQTRIKQLQMELLKILGGGVWSSPNPNNSIGAAGPGEEFMHLPSHHTDLILRLAEQKVLIVLDDVWEEDVVEKLLVPGMGVKYLVTSQMRSIWRGDATKIGLQNPDIIEARRIMANFTEGLPTKGEFPDNIQQVTDAIIKRLNYHPLSLANVGIAINRSKAADPREWETVKENIRDELDDVDFCPNPPVYGTRYPLTVGASMMLMVDSLPPGPRRLLFLMGVLEGPVIPEVVVKFFFRFIEPRYKYQRQINYLDDRSLVELHCHRAYEITVDAEDHMSRFDLGTHDLRTFFTRKNHTVDVRSIATEIVSSGSGSSSNHGVQSIQGGGTEENLVTIMSAMYFEESFRDVVAPKFQSRSRIFNANVIPRSMSYEVDVLDLMDRAQSLKWSLRSLVWLLNPDGEGGWKQQAHEYAKKIVIRLAFRKELDDESMAQLIQLPQTTIVACGVMQVMVKERLFDFALVYHKNKIFSCVHGKTMKSLLCLLGDDVATASKRAAGIAALGCVLDYESEDTIQKVAKKWVEFLAKECNPTLQTAVARVLSNLLPRGRLVVGEFPEVLDRLLILMFEGKNSDVQYHSAYAICSLVHIPSSIRSRLMMIPSALEILSRAFQDSSRDQRYLANGSYLKSRGFVAGNILCWLSFIPEFRVRFTRVHDGLKGLIEMLASHFKGLTEMLASGPKGLKEVLASGPKGLTKMLTSESWTPEISHFVTEMITGKSWRRSKSDSAFDSAFVLPACIVGNLASTNEVPKIILATAPELQKGLRLQMSLLLLQLFMSSANCRTSTTLPSPKYIYRDLYDISRVMTILDPLQANTPLVTIPPPHLRACFLTQVGLEGPSCIEMARCSMELGRGRACLELGLYSEVLGASNIANVCGHSEHDRLFWCQCQDFYRHLRMSSKAMMKDYVGAMLDADSAVEKHQLKILDKKRWSTPALLSVSKGERGVLKHLSGKDLNEALIDLDEALADMDNIFKDFVRHWKFMGNPCKIQYGLLKHRGLVKHLMGDEVGARADAESALQLKRDRLVWEETLDALWPRWLLDLPVNYLGFTL